ncbi:MAG: hypothetical protein Q8O47_03810 [Candidatus Bathyarchaeota archaeon]|nr:hypothetical protein [Candidatus Bathyarchaeota archaeon]
MERLEEISDENLFWLYHEELETIDRGSSITSPIPKPVTRRLIASGVVEYGKGLDETSGLVLSPRCREMPDSYKAEI